MKKEFEEKLKELEELCPITEPEELLLLDAIGMQLFTEVPLTRTNLNLILNENMQRFFYSRYDSAKFQPDDETSENKDNQGEELSLALKDGLLPLSLLLGGALVGAALGAATVAMTKEQKSKKKQKYIDSKLDQWKKAGIIKSEQATKYHQNSLTSPHSQMDKRTMYHFFTSIGYIYYLTKIGSVFDPLDIEMCSFQSLSLAAGSSLLKSTDGSRLIPEATSSHPIHKAIFDGLDQIFQDGGKGFDRYVENCLSGKKFHREAAKILEADLQDLLEAKQFSENVRSILEKNVPEGSVEIPPNIHEVFAWITSAFRKVGADSGLAKQLTAEYSQIRAQPEFIIFCQTEQRKQIEQNYLEIRLIHLQKFIELHKQMAESFED